MRERIKNLCIFTLLFIVEVLIALYIRDRFIRPYVGDVLVVLLYFAIRVIWPMGIRLLPLYVTLFACMVEASQYFNLVTLLGLTDNRLARTLLGSTFDWADVVCYLVGGATVWGYQRWIRAKKRYDLRQISRCLGLVMVLMCKFDLLQRTG